MPGGHRTGAPGKHVISGKAKYRLLDEKVRVFVAPPIEDIEQSPVRMNTASNTDSHSNYLRVLQLKAYVSTKVPVSRSFTQELYGKLPRGGLTAEHYYKIAPRLESS